MALRELPWLRQLLQIKFYVDCECMSSKHGNFYCKDCMGSPFCEDCSRNPKKHEGHGCLRVYKSSNRTAIRVVGLKNVLDISDIQTYICNSSKLVYIHKKQRPEGASIARKSDKCEVCGCDLQYTTKFCSIECKVNGEVEEDDTATMITLSASATAAAAAGCDELQFNQTSQRIRKRKGEPLRSPLF